MTVVHRKLTSQAARVAPSRQVAPPQVSDLDDIAEKDIQDAVIAGLTRK